MGKRRDFIRDFMFTDSQGERTRLIAVSTEGLKTHLYFANAQNKKDGVCMRHTVVSEEVKYPEDIAQGASSG